MESFLTKIAAFCVDQSRRYNYYRMALLVCIGMAVYSNTLSAPFIFDDSANIVNSPLIMDLSLAGIKGAFYSTRAIGIITFQLNYYLSGWNVLGYHLTNIFIHICAALAVYRLLQQLMKTEYFVEKADDRFRSLPLPFFAALFFAVHPVQTQAVTYIVQRFASLAALFYLAAVISYLAARIEQYRSGRMLTAKSVAWYFATLLSGFLAFFTKETSYTLPLAILLVELLFFRSSPRKIFWLVAASGSAVFAVLLKYASATHSVQQALSAIDEAARMQTVTARSDYLFTQFRVIMTYLRLIFLPVNQRLDYDYTLSRSFMDWQVLCSFLFLLILLLAALWMVRISRDGSPLFRLAAFGIFWFFLALSVESSIIPIIDLIFEHRLYLPLFGAATTVTSLVLLPAWKRDGSSGKGVCLGLLLVSLLLALTAYKRNSVWKSDVSIWADTVKKSPVSARAWNNLGAAYILHKDAANSLRATIRSIELDPSKPDAWNNLGIAIDIMGAYNDRFNRTYEMFRTPGSRKGEIINSWLGDVNNNLGLAYEILGELPKAAAAYRKAVGFNPYLGLAYYNLGIASAKMNDPNGYFEQVNMLNKLDPILARRLRATVEMR